MKSPWIFTLLIGFCTAQAATKPAAEIEAMLAESQKAGVFNGVALVVQQDRVIVRRAQGAFDAAGSRALETSDRFLTGSIAKEFSAVVLLQLAEAGKLSLDDPLSRHLKDLPPWANDIPLRTLLDYTSGLPELRWADVHGDADARRDLQTVTELLAKPGSAYRYTYMNVMARQFVIEAVTGEPFVKTLSTLFERCGIRKSVVDPVDAEPRVARSFSPARVDDPTDRPVSGMPFMTVDDLAKWERCLHRRSLLRADSLSALAGGSRHRQGALGIAEVRDGMLVAHVHQGSARNFEALLRYDSARDVTIVLLTNSKRQKVHEIANAIAAILEGKPWEQPK